MNEQGVADSYDIKETDVVCIQFATQAYENCLDYLTTSYSWNSRKDNDVSMRCIKHMKKIFEIKLKEKKLK